MRFLDFERPIYEIEKKIEELKKLTKEHPEFAEEIKALEEQSNRIKVRIYSQLTEWQKVQLARHPDRPHAVDFINGMIDDFVELHGDRHYGDDPAIVGGIGKLEGLRLVVIGQEKGRSTNEKIRRNFGMPHPEGYRKARRLMELAEKFSLPVFTIVDTPGAYPGVGAEERGQSMAIAENLKVMLQLKTPILTLIIGEGGSGGALGIAVADRVLAMQYSIYSVISPEGCASIIWRDGKLAPKAAEALKLTPEPLRKLGIVDEIIEEPLGGAHRDPETAIKSAKDRVLHHLRELVAKDPIEVLKERRDRYRRIGYIEEVTLSS
ncbi:MAG: acetyl-CoA carboxylase carboxyl transferase subunit alpha [Candidatus Hydrothermota bacterium]|nr:MAG: acetyl-CoA carboxylase carboxyl transferase subunit alpha [Candidatus Hydrothermae bacterium]